LNFNNFTFNLLRCGRYRGVTGIFGKHVWRYA